MDNGRTTAAAAATFRMRFPLVDAVFVTTFSLPLQPRRIEGLLFFRLAGSSAALHAPPSDASPSEPAFVGSDRSCSGKRGRGLLTGSHKRRGKDTDERTWCVAAYSSRTESDLASLPGASVVARALFGG